MIWSMTVNLNHIGIETLLWNPYEPSHFGQHD